MNYEIDQKTEYRTGNDSSTGNYETGNSCGSCGSCDEQKYQVF